MQETILKFHILLGMIFALSVIAHGQDLASKNHALMPVPADVNWTEGRLNITADFSVALIGQTDERLKNYVSRVMRRLEGRTVMTMPRGFSDDSGKAVLLIETGSVGRAIPALGDDESYVLEINNKQARLNAPTTVGAMRGLETLLQLVEGDRTGFYLPAVKIDDRPRFPWRGLMIDSARHFQPLEVIKRNLDGMAAVKLNVLHWHLTEDQGFRVETRSYPKLHQLGSDGLFYTQAEIRDVIKYAADRGIRVMPEFDMPGHATAWVVGHPELASAPGPYEIERRPGIFDPTLDPTKDETYQLLDGFLTEMAGLFPDAYLHIGGDENEGKQWDANPQIQGFMRENGIKDNHGLQTYFNKRVLKILEKNHKVMMGWDEIFQPDLPKDVVIHSWRGQEALAAAARQGYSGVLSNGFYIDLSQPASEHYLVEPLPADTNLSTAEQKRVLGGEATMWSEWVSPETIDSRIWPRTAAIAERLWSPRDVRDVDDMYRRLEKTAIRLEELGLTHRRNQAMLLRRLIGEENIDALGTLVSLIEPVKQYRRYQQRPQTMLSPLTGLVDAAQPDAPAARRINRFIDRILAEKDFSNTEDLALIFLHWQMTGAALVPVMENAPALHEAKMLASDLQQLGEIGYEAVSYLQNEETPPAAWSDEKLNELAEIAKPKAALEFAVIDRIRKLVVAAADLNGPKN